MTNVSPDVSNIANWIIYLNVGAVILLAVGGPLFAALIRKWINNIVSRDACEKNQAECREKVAGTLTRKLSDMEVDSKKEYDLIYMEIKQNREKSMQEFSQLQGQLQVGATILQGEIKKGMDTMTRLFIEHIQKNATKS